MGLCLLSSNLHLFHDELVKGVLIPFFLSLVLNAGRSSKMLSEPFCLFGAYCLLDSIPFIPVIALVSG